MTTYNYNSSMVIDYNSTFSIYTPIGSNQQVNIYQEQYQAIPSNYVIFLNIINYNFLFNTKSYIDNTDTVSYNVTVNTIYLQGILNSPNSSVILRGTEGLNDNVSGLENVLFSSNVYSCTTQNLGFRLLEIASLNIFNNARARAAVANDTDFIYGKGINYYSGQGETGGNSNLYTSLANQINYAFNVEAHNIFNQYVNTWRYNASVDVNKYQNYNFDNTNFQILMTYQVNTYGINRGYTTLLPRGFNKTILLVLTDYYNIGDIVNQYN